MARQRDSIGAALSPAGEAALWQAARGADAGAREALIEHFLPFARILAAKLYAGRIDHDLEFDDYLQFATIGLIEAVDRYDAVREAQFKTFAAHRIHGAILNGIEHMSEKRQQIATRKRLQLERRDSAKVALAQDAKDVFQQLADVAIGLALGYILDNPASDHHEAALVPENQYTALELRQLRAKIHALVERLPQRERMVIKYHYLNQMPFQDIAATMELSKGRVSQIHHKALELLRGTLAAVRACDVAW